MADVPLAEPGISGEQFPIHSFDQSISPTTEITPFVEGQGAPHIFDLSNIHDTAFYPSSNNIPSNGGNSNNDHYYQDGAPDNNCEEDSEGPNQPVKMPNGLWCCNGIDREKGTVCQKTFEKRYGANRHHRTHRRPVECEIPECKFRFAQNKGLLRHYLVHHPGSDAANRPEVQAINGSCPYPECDYEGRRDNVGRHIKKVHKTVSDWLALS